MWGTEAPGYRLPFAAALLPYAERPEGQADVTGTGTEDSLHRTRWLQRGHRQDCHSQE